MLRRVLCWVFIAVTPMGAAGTDPSAMLYGKGVLRNGESIPGPTAVFSGDLLETKTNSIANLNSLGSSVVIVPGSLIEFQGQSILLEHGGVSIATSHGLAVRVGCVTIVPLSSDLTRFDVSDVNGTIEIAAKQKDVKLDRSLGSTKEVSNPRLNDILREGEQTSRNESACNDVVRKRDLGATPAANGGILNSTMVRAAALAAGGLGVYLATDDDDPPSPWKP